MINKQFCDLLAVFLVEIKKKFGITAKLLTDELNLSKNTLTNWKKVLINRMENYQKDF